MILRVLGLAAFVAAARAAWLPHQDNQAVIRTDLMSECFAAGQAAERTRAAEEKATMRVWTPRPPPDWLAERRITVTDVERLLGAEGPPELADGYRVHYLTEPPEEPEGPGWTEHDDRYGGTSR